MLCICRRQRRGKLASGTHAPAREEIRAAPGCVVERRRRAREISVEREPQHRRRRRRRRRRSAAAAADDQHQGMVQEEYHRVTRLAQLLQTSDVYDTLRCSDR